MNENKTSDKEEKAPTVIDDLPGQRVELYRLTHGGALPTEPYNEEHEQIMLAAHCNAYERGHSFGIVERRLFSEIYRLRAKLEHTLSATLPTVRALDPVVSPEPNIYGVPPRYPFQIGEHIFWDEGGDLRARPSGHPSMFLSGKSATDALFKELRLMANNSSYVGEKANG